MTSIETLRDACLTLTDRGSTPMMRAKGERALAALAELEKAAATPVAWLCVEEENDDWILYDSEESAKKWHANAEPLYTAPPPMPVAEMREPTPEECAKIARRWYSVNFGVEIGQRHGRDMFDAVRAVMWPKGGES